MRNYTLAQLDDAHLRTKQKETVQALLNARPVEGFPTTDHSAPTTLEGYVARQLFWHMRGTLGEGEGEGEGKGKGKGKGEGEGEGEAPLGAWLVHKGT